VWGRYHTAHIKYFLSDFLQGSSQPNVAENAPADAPGGAPQKEIPHVFDAMYHLDQELGRGAFSVVKRGVNRQTHEVRAVKICERGSMSPEDEEALFREVDVMKKLNHPHIVKLFDFFVESDKYYLVLEFLEGGELFDRIVQKKVYNEKEARDCVKAVLSGLKYMHDQNIAHRDLKPENLLLASKDNDVGVKIADFGFAAMRKAGVGMETQCGTPNYVAPEILSGNGDYSKAVDMWSMGVIIYIILGGYPVSALP
jgi:serine/threonine protein kinase